MARPTPLIALALSVTGLAGLAVLAGCGTELKAPAIERCGDSASPGRLTVDGRRFLDPSGAPIELRGANMQGADARAAEDLVALGMTFARYRVTFGAETRDDGDASGFSAEYQGEICDGVKALSASGVWVLLELRGDDDITNDPDLYDPKSDLFSAWAGAWRYLASAYRGSDKIAGFGVLAEPSASRGDREPADTLTGFQLAVMDAITEKAGDDKTLFFVGPDYNYDTMGYRYDAYFDALSKYRGRLAYEVNCLVPKPWIADGTGPDGVPQAELSYPQPAPADFGFLTTVAPGEGFVYPKDAERIFSARSEDPALFPKMLNRPFLAWYLGFAGAFAEKHQVPMIVDQFGASVDAAGQLAFERDVIEVAEGLGLGWSRWAYNAGSKGRMIVGQPAVHDFYRMIGAR